MILVGDVHIAADRTRYSILKVKPRRDNPYSERFSTRLVHLIETFKWIEEYVKQKKVPDQVVQLGDIVSKANLTAEELRMIEEIAPITQKWKAIRGNHGLAANEHDSDCAVKFSRLYRKPLWQRIRVPLCDYNFIGGCYNLVYLPYVLERDRKPLKEYLQGMNRSLPTVILSHNDIKGMKYGGITEKKGWSIEELEEWGDYIINAHIHNTQWVTDKILITGNVDGENLNEDYRAYPHGIWDLNEMAVLQRKPLKECIKFVQNPYAMKFANVEIKKEEDIEKIKAESDDKTILAITVPESLADKAQELIDTHLAGGKKIVKADKKRKEKSADNKLITENHIDKFKRCAVEEFGELSIIEEI